MSAATSPTAVDVLASTWLDWADRIERLPDDEWARPTRCEGWTVHALVAHATPDPALLATLPSLAGSGEAAVDDAAEALRTFNRASGASTAMAPAIAAAAVAATQVLTPAEMAHRFRASAELATAMDLPADAVVPYPAVGSIRAEGLVDVAIMEATVHLLDLIAAVGGPPPPDAAVDRTRSVLARVADPIALIEAAAGRTDPATALPVIR